METTNQPKYMNSPRNSRIRQLGACEMSRLQRKEPIDIWSMHWLFSHNYSPSQEPDKTSVESPKSRIVPQQVAQPQSCHMSPPKNSPKIHQTCDSKCMNPTIPTSSSSIIMQTHLFRKSRLRDEAMSHVIGRHNNLCGSLPAAFTKNSTPNVCTPQNPLRITECF